MPFVKPITFFKTPAASGPTQLLDLDFRTPNTQAFPTSATGIIPGVTFDEVFLFDEASGNLVGEITSEALTASGSPTYSHIATGLYNGTDCYNKKCVRTDANNERFDSTSTTLFDSSDTVSFACLFVARVTERGASSNTHMIMRNIVTSPTRGYEFKVASSSLTATIYTSSGSQTASDSTYSPGSGALFAGMFAIDRAAGVLRVHFAGGSQTAATITLSGSTATGAAAAVARTTGFNTSALDVCYLATVKGSEAEGWGQSELDAFWDAYKQYTSPSLSTYTRASMACPEVGNESGFGLRVAKVSSGLFAFGWNTNLSHASKLGALIEPAATNLCTYSDQFDNAAWSKSNITVAANDVEAPDGSLTADKLTASADNGTIQSASITRTSSADYTASVYIKRVGGSDVTGRLIHYDVTGAAEETATAFTATSTWTRISVRDASAASTSGAIRIEIDTNGQAIYAWGAQFEADHLSSYIPTTSASATRAATTAKMDNTGTTYRDVAQGEVEVVTALHENSHASATRYLFMANSTTAGTAVDRQLFAVLSGADDRELFDRVWNGSGSIATTAQESAAGGDWSGEIASRARWKSTGVLSGHSECHDIYRDTTRTAGDDGGTTWSTNGADQGLWIGQSQNAALQVNGVISRVRIWNGPRSDTP